MEGHRHRGSSFNFGRIFTIVIALHIVVGGGALWLAKTQAGQDFARVYNIKLFEPPKPPEQAKEEPPPPPPPKPDVAPPPPPTAAPKLASAAPAGPAPAVSLGGGGGPNWSGGKFQSGLGDGPMGAFHGAVAGRLRRCKPKTPEQFSPLELEFVFSDSGAVKSYRLARSSGNKANDEAALEAAGCVQSSGPFELPEKKPLVVTVKMTPY